MKERIYYTLVLHSYIPPFFVPLRFLHSFLLCICLKVPLTPNLTFLLCAKILCSSII